MNDQKEQSNPEGIDPDGNFTESSSTDPSEKPEVHPREIEVKIVKIGSPEILLERILRNQGKLVKDRRLLRDTAFKLPKEGGKEESFDLDTTGLEDVENLRSTLQFMGMEVVDTGDNRLRITSQKDLPNRTVRIRQDGETVILTVKEKRKPNSKIANRIEREVTFPDLALAQQLLEKMGYQQNAVREKYRTTWQIGNALVELNEGPVAPPWAEVEGQSPEEVERIIEALGYQSEDTADISDTEYYRRCKVPEKKLTHLTFEKTEE